MKKSLSIVIEIQKRIKLQIKLTKNEESSEFAGALRTFAPTAYIN